MMVRRRFSMAVAAGAAGIVAAFGRGVPAAFAGDEWCTSDPAMPVKTPKDNQVIVYVNGYAQGSEHQAAVNRMEFDHTVTSINNATQTQVNARVKIPNDQYGSGYPTRTVISSQAHAQGTIYGEATGTAGNWMYVTFVLNVP